MTWDKKLSAVTSLSMTAIAGLLGGFDVALQVLLLFMAIDFVTGVMRSFVNKETSSSVGMKGIAKKVMILCVIAVAVGVDRMIGGGEWIRLLVIWFYAAMEGISILENAAGLGVPVPEKLKDALAQLKDGQKKAGE